MTGANGPPGEAAAFYAASASGPNEFIVRVNGSLVEVSDQMGALLASQAIDDTSEMVVRGQEGSDNIFSIDSTLLDLSSDFHLRIQGGTAQDTLQIIDRAGSIRQWRIEGDGAGGLENLTFAGIENIIGGEDNNDTFVFGDEGGLVGTLDGGARGFDTIILDGGVRSTVVYTATGPDSGTLELDDRVLQYVGVEPIIDNADAVTRIFLGSSSAACLVIAGQGSQLFGQVGCNICHVSSITTAPPGTVINGGAFPVPSALLTIDGGSGDDLISLDPLVFPLTQNIALFTIDGGAGTANTVSTSSISNLSLDDSFLSAGGNVLAFLTHIQKAVLAGPVLDSSTFTGSVSFTQVTGIPNWVDQGPGPMVGGQSVIGTTNPVTGAVQMLAFHPFDPKIIFAATVSGGVWRSIDGGSSWKPLTDQFPTLAMSAIAVSPLDSDGVAVNATTALDKVVVYAGTGKILSSTSVQAGLSVGLLRSTNGGDTWKLGGAKELAGLTITGAVGTSYPISYVNAVSNVNSSWVTLTNLVLPSSPYLLIDSSAPDVPA